jgi:hypothetical protein
MAHAWTDMGLVVWSATADLVAVYETITDTWTELPAVGFGPGTDLSALRFTEGRLYALAMHNPTLQTPCQTMAALLDNGTWKALASPSTCIPYSTALEGRLYGFSSVERPLVFDPATEGWVDLPAAPVHGCEGFPPPLSTNREILVFDWCDHSALYEPATNTWREIAIPDDFSMTNAVWTGSEVVSWGDYCCYGVGAVPLQVSAWRLTP